MPQLYIKDIILDTAPVDRHLSPVTGQIPPLAKVLAKTDKLSQVISKEHICKGNFFQYIGTYFVLKNVLTNCEENF
jgi:hypothetical protein